MENFGDNVINFFKQATAKLEELQVQSHLGEAELSDKWEELKKETLHKYADVKAKVKGAINDDKEEYTKLKAKLEHLELQLALGKAETKEKLQEQKHELKNALHDLKEMFQ